jgi:hypothetical protein
VGKVVQPMQSVNCHDSHAHDHEWHEPFTRLVGIWSGRVLGLVGLAAGVRPMRYVWFGYRGETYELCLVLATRVRPVSWWAWVTVG